MRSHQQRQNQPERVLQLNEQDTKLDLTKPEPNEETTQNEPMKEIPPNTIYGCNLKKIKSYKNIRKSYKLKNQKQVFITDLKAVLNEFPIDNHQYNDELLIEILNIAECYFVYGNNKEREAVKNESIIEIMKPYFKDDEELLLKTISHVWHKVSKSNFFKRSLQRFKLFFFQKSI
jgi:hypothetical protein